MGDRREIFFNDEKFSTSAYILLNGSGNFRNSNRAESRARNSGWDLSYKRMSTKLVRPTVAG